MDPPVANTLPPMDPPPVPNRKRCHSPVLGSLKYPFVYVPGDGTRIGRFVPRGSGAEFSPQYCFPDQTPPPPPPPGCEEKEHAPGPSVPLGAAKMVQQDGSSSNLIPGTTTCWQSPIAAAYLPSPQQPSPVSLDPPGRGSSYPFWLWPHTNPCRYLGRRLTPSLGPDFHRRVQFQWGIEFYIRMDHAGYYHIYPHVGKTFPSLHEADHAIKHYLHSLRDPKMFEMHNVSQVDIAVRQCLYYPDGARRRPLRSGPVDIIRDSKHQLVHALVDKYNEDNNLLGNLAYGDYTVMRYNSFSEGDVHTWYHHVNFSARTKRGRFSIFFAEIIFLQGESGELPVSCLCIVDATPYNNGNCYGCVNHGETGVMHPNNVGYVGGHVMNTFMPFNGPKINTSEFDDEDLEAEEARLRSSLQCLDNPQLSVNPPGSLAKKYPGPPGFLGSGIPGQWC